MTLARILENEILPLVEKPSRYLGNEVNAVRKDPDAVDVRMALAFPDLYDLGLGNLGIHILYAVVNALPWASCERVYAPGVDMEAQLRERSVPLFSLENKTPLGEMDLLGFTLQSELTYTNILNMLDLSGIALRSEKRVETDPLICAGGPAVFNPEPIAPFIDFFVIGDGEDVIAEIAQVLRDVKGRSERLLALSKLEGIYVPALFPMETMPDGRVLPELDAAPIRKRITRDLDGATFPVDYVVPFTQQVHDRISLEVLRGCTQGCRFCQAGMTTRPVRERGLDKVDELLDRTLKTTGYEEVSLVSLSTCDHSRVRALVENTVERARPNRVSVSLPSLRLDSFSVELADMVAETRRTGLTVAPEAASPRLRAVINKWIPDEGLLDMTRGAYERGWGHVKMYFMIGLPTERDDDILAIADLAKRAVAEGKAITSRARANLGVSTFVPKPFTPFQWAEQIGGNETERRQDLLGEALDGHSAIKFGRHDPEETFLEGLVSRADRRAGDLIEEAWRLGARFDAWREHLNFAAWTQAIDNVEYDVRDALRARDVDERLPWDHIDILIPKSWFQADWKRALELQHAADCRHSKCHKCGVIDRERPLCAAMLRRSVKGRAPEAEWTRKPTPEFEEPVPVQRLWVRVHRKGSARFLSHIEAVNAWLRALRRVDTPLSYSQGFHPHPKLAFSSALPVQLESVGEYMDITLSERMVVGEWLQRLAGTLPEGFEAVEAFEVSMKAPALMALNRGADYEITLPEDSGDAVQERVDALLGASSLLVQRRSKSKGHRRRGRHAAPTKELDVRESLRNVHVQRASPAVTVAVRLFSEDGPLGKIREIVERLTDAPERASVRRLETLANVDGQAVPLLNARVEPPKTDPLSANQGPACSK